MLTVFDGLQRRLEAAVGTAKAMLQENDEA